jgi:hypothetical protein
METILEKSKYKNHREMPYFETSEASLGSVSMYKEQRVKTPWTKLG